MKIYFPDCLIESGIAREENFSFWKKCLGGLEEVVIPPHVETPLIKSKIPGCECKGHLKVYPHGCLDLIPYKIHINFHGASEEELSVGCTCVGELTDEVSEIIKKEQLEKLLGGVIR
jgi:hypothetical protein